MAAHHIAVCVQIIPGRIGLAGVAFHEGNVIAVGDKADILAVPLAGVDEAVLFRNAADFLFGQFPEGEADVGQLILGKGGQKISLILGAVCCFI